MPIPLVRTEYWDADLSIVPMYLILDSPIPSSKQEGLRQLVYSWFDVGYYGAFGGSVLDVSKFEFTDHFVRWIVDFHGLPTIDPAIAMLHTCLQNYASEHSIGIEKIIVGWADIK